MGQAAARKPFVLEVKDDIFLPDGEVAVLDYDDKSHKYPAALEMSIPGEAIFDWIKKKAQNDQPLQAQ